MAVVKKRGSLLWGVLFTSIGLILLAKNLGYNVSVWYIIGKYWPLLLILVGVAKIIDYYRFGSGVSIRFRDVTAVVFIMLFGMLAAKIAALNLEDLSLPIPRGWKIPIINILHNSYTYYEEVSYPCTAQASFVISNSDGDIELQPGALDEIRVKLNKKVYENTEEQAKSIAQQIKLSVRQENGVYGIKTNREDLSENKRYKYETSMSIVLPKQAHITVDNKRGSVRLEGFHGNQTVQCSGGRVTINDVKGDVKASNRDESMNVTNVSGNAEIACKNTRIFVEHIDGNLAVENYLSRSEVFNVAGKALLKNKEGSLRAERLKGPVEIDVARSRVEVRDAAGEVQITSSGSKPIVIENVASNVRVASDYSLVNAKDIKGNLAITTNNSEIRVADISGALDIKGEVSSIQAEELKGAASITTTRGDVVINSFEKPVNVRNEYGDVSVAAGSELKGNLDVVNQTGRIELILPEDSNFKIEARSKSGEVESEFTGNNLKITNDGDGSIIGSYGQGGPLIKLETNHGQISLRKGTEGRSLRSKPSKPAPRSKRPKRGKERPGYSL
jgi:hypothetical protein